MQLCLFRTCVTCSTLALVFPISFAKGQKVVKAFSLKTSPVIDGHYDAKNWAGEDNASFLWEYSCESRLLFIEGRRI